MEFVVEKIGIGESSDIKQGSDDDKLQFNDTPELRGRLAGHLRGYYPSLVMNILYGDLNKVNEEIKYYLSKIESRIQEHDEFMEGVIFVADVKIVGREEMCKWKNFVERMKLILGYRKEQLLLAQEELRNAITTTTSKPIAIVKAIISHNPPAAM
ncbi:hypothetical protein FBF25_01185 [Candidatus Saccharibacteria bacterium oral taxon 488]|nr:hypothetical protein FBF25_01185 [Candidatus Saccharibacteria bacterium oral taxon 488]